MSDDYERIISNSKEIVKTIQATELQLLTESNRQLHEELEKVKAELKIAEAVANALSRIAECEKETT